MVEPVLQTKNLSVTYKLSGSRGRLVRAVSDVNLSFAAGETVGLVGESGCGKSSLARAIVGLESSTGEILFNGQPLLARRTRAQARQVQIVFQDPYASLNPRLSVRHTLEEMLRVHRICSKAEVAHRAKELVELVGLPSRVLNSRPSGLSGGQRQRVAIARALALEPKVLVADEPTTALDVSVQAVILELFAELRQRLDLTILLITHNLAVVSAICDRTAVMYLGRIIEEAPTIELLADAKHPYSRRLLSAVPRIGDGALFQVEPLTGDPPDPADLPAGCAFHPRCPMSAAQCRLERPTLLSGSDASTGVDGHRVACHFAFRPPPKKT